MFGRLSQRNIETKFDSLDDLLLLLSVLSNLEKECNRDISAFDYSIDLHSYGYDEYDDEWTNADEKEREELKEKVKFRAKVIKIHFDPRNVKDHPLADRGTMNVELRPTSGVLVLYSSERHRDGRHYEYDIWEPFGNKKIKRDIKLKVVSMYKKIRKFRDETVPIQNRQEFLDSLSQKFPNAAIDAALLRDTYEEVKSGDDRGVSSERREDNDPTSNRSSS